MADMDLKAIAQLLQKSGRGNDTILAHITKKEADRLKKQGGSGTVNPETGLLEFDDSGYMAGADYTGYNAPTPAPDYSVAAQPQVQTAPSGGGYDPVTQTGGYTYSADPYATYNAPQTTGQAPVFDATSAAQTPTFSYGLPEIAQVTGAPLPQTRQPTLPMAYDSSTGVGQLGPISETTPAPQEKSILDRVKSTTGLSEEALKKLGMAGVTGLTGLLTGNKARQQGQQATRDMQAMAAPYQQQGKELLSQAQSGTLTAANQQALQAAQARLAQDAQSRGGVGAQQAATQIENLRQQLLAGQYDLGLKVSSIGDNIALGAIKTGLQADQYVNAANQEFYTQMAQILGGQPVTQRPVVQQA